MISIGSVSSGSSSRAFTGERLKPNGNINKLSAEAEAKIFSYLKPSDLGKVSSVDKRRNEAVSTFGEKTPSLKDRSIYRDFAFNSKDWKKYCNKDVDMEGEMSSFPKDIWKELNKPCKAFPGKRIGQTHMITWMPKKMGGEDLTLNSFGRVLKERFPENGYIWNPIVLEHGERGLAKSYWVFMTRDVIPRSRGKSYEVQQGLVANLDRKDPYKVPKTLEAVVCISTKYFKTGERLFNDDPWSYTRCQEQSQGYQVVVGGFAAAGIIVCGDFYGNDDDGVGALRSSVLDT